MIVASPGSHMSDKRVRLVYKELQKISGSSDLSNLSVHEVVKAAKNPKNPLHSEFQWNIEKAAYKHWCETARRLISAVRVVVINRDGIKAEVREIISIKRQTENKTKEYFGFISRSTLKKQADTRARYSTTKCDALLYWCNSVCDLEEFDEIRKLIIGWLNRKYKKAA